jgi:hypothetical protein
MSILEAVMIRRSLAALAPLALVAGCATGGSPAQVTRFHGGQPIGRGTVALVPPPGQEGSLEFQGDAAAIAPALARAGFTVVPGGGRADFQALVDVRRGTREGAPRGPRFSIGLGGGSFGRHTGVGLGTSVGVGGRRGATLVGTELFVQLRRPGEATALWEGRARTEARLDRPEGQPAAAVARLADAMFQGFPGESGRTVMVK